MNNEKILIDEYYGLNYIFDYITYQNYCLDSFNALTKHIKVFHSSRNIVDEFINKFKEL